MPYYAEIKNKYCLCYFGNCEDYIMQMLYLRPWIETQLPGIEVHICCRDESAHLIKDVPKCSIRSLMDKRDFAHCRLIACNMTSHPIWDLFVESNLKWPAPTPSQSPTRKCVIYPRGNAPTMSLTDNMTDRLVSRCALEGYTIQIEGDMENAGWVVGVENHQLFAAGFKGVRTSLVPTGLGTELYQKLIRGEIIQL